MTIGRGILAGVDAAFQQAFGSQPAVVVADENTYAVAGQAVRDQLSAAGRPQAAPFIFPGRPVLHADFEHVLELEAGLRTHAAIPVAVGSGTVNDLAKLAAHRCGRPYMVVATAASMDGYTAFGAAITRAGYKQTMTCPAPRAVLADTEILATAPAAMTAAGYADLLGKVTAGADWLLADALGIEPIHATAWSLVQPALRAWTARPAALPAGDQAALADLIEGLIMSGLAMQAAQSSRPASGAEHLFSHLWEMEGLGQDRPLPLSHGFKVGVGSIACAALYEALLQRDLTRLPAAALAAAWPAREAVEQAVRQAHSVPGLREAAVQESLLKHITGQQLAGRLG
ncbi:MAG: sn-glycerol-1-phosphate dehydrogenase, partial [Anaerolineales bacterium]|nr:sn-glycerol-1-phosphate dehydrogenase [Anaerolineales bacterium]